MSETLLEVRGLTAGYDGAAVLRNLDLTVSSGEIVALLGANGAGKTTTLRTISGIVQPMSGSVAVLGADIAKTPPHRLFRNGLGHVAEGRSIFYGLTVAEHFRLGHRGEKLDTARAYDYFPKLKELENRRAGVLSGGEQQMLALARALSRSPRLLLIDELSLGLAPVIVEQLLPVVRRFVVEENAGAILVEQHVDLALGIADKGVILSHGEVKARAEARTLLDDKDIFLASYLGEANEAGESGLTTDPAACRLDHIGLSVEDLAAEADFYRRAFGFDEEVAFELPFEGIQVIMLLHPSGFRLELFGHPESKPGLVADGPIEAHGTRGFGHLALAVDAIHELYAHAVEQGARPVKDPEYSPRLGTTFGFLADPEGHLIELLIRGQPADGT